MEERHKQKQNLEQFFNLQIILEQCRKKLTPPVTMVNTQDELRKYQQDKNNVIILYFGETRSEAFKEYEETVYLFNSNELKFLASVNLMNKFDIPDIPYIILLKSFDKTRVDYQGQMDSEQLKKFIIANMFPRIVKLSDAASEYVFGDNHPVFLLYLNNLSALTEEENNARNIFYDCAKDIKLELMLSECDLTNEVCTRLSDFTGIQNYSTPLFQILDPRGSSIKKYIFQQDNISKDTIKAFVQQFEIGALKPFLKSQNIPIQEQTNKIKQIVGQNFQEEVINKKENIVVKFYAEWCTQSQQCSIFISVINFLVKPIYEKLAELLPKESNLIFVEIDGSENEVFGIEIDFFPTVILFQSENKENPIIYKGEKTLDKLTEFIQNNVKFQGEKYEKLKEKVDL